MNTNCNLGGGVERILPFESSSKWLMLGADGFCAVDLDSPGSPPGIVGTDVPPRDAPKISAPSLKTELDTQGIDLEYDPLRDRLYVSIEILDQVVSYDRVTLAKVDTFDIGSPLHSIDFSPTGSELALALSGASQIGFLDVDMGMLETLDISQALGIDRATEVEWMADDAVFVGTDSGVSYIARVSRSAGTSERVADGRLIAGSMDFEGDPQSSRLYIGNTGIPRKIYVLDASDPISPVVDETELGHLSDVDSLALSPEAAAVVLRSGEVLRTSDLSQIGRVGEGRAVYSADGASIAVAKHQSLHFYDAMTFDKELIVEHDCRADSALTRIAANTWAIISGLDLCIIEVPIDPQSSSKTQNHASAYESAPYVCDAECLMRRLVVPRIGHSTARQFRLPMR